MSVVEYKETDGRPRSVSHENPLPVDISANVSIDLNPGDVEIGAVELKDGASDNRATVDSSGRLSTKDGPETLSDGAEVAVGAASGTIIAANAGRVWVRVENVGTQPVRIGTVTPITNVKGVTTLWPYDAATLHTHQAVYGIRDSHATGDGSVLVSEGS